MLRMLLLKCLVDPALELLELVTMLVLHLHQVLACLVPLLLQEPVILLQFLQQHCLLFSLLLRLLKRLLSLLVLLQLF